MLSPEQEAALRDLIKDWEGCRHLSPDPDYSSGYDSGQQSAAWALEEVLDKDLFKTPAQAFVVTANEGPHADLLGVRLTLDAAKALAEEHADPYFGGPLLPAWSDAETSGSNTFYTLTVQIGPADWIRYEVDVKPL